MARKYPAVFALVAVIVGILLADSCTVPSWIYLFFGFGLLMVLIAFYYKKKVTIAGLMALLCLAMLSAYGYSFRMKTYPPGHISHFVDDDIRYTIYGTIVDWPLLREHRTDIIINVDSIGLARQIKKGRGRLLVRIGKETTDLRYGDRVYFDSRLYSIKGGANPTGFNYRRYLNLKGVFGVAYLSNQYSIQIDPLEPGRFARIIGEMRKYITDTFSKTLDSNSAALASGFLIGDTRNIPTEIYNRFRDSGTLHLLAVSGSNVALVLIVFVFLLRASKMKSWSRTVLLLLIIYIFSNLAFNQPSVVRAALMASIVLIGKFLQRRIELNNIIALTAFIILLVSPTQLFDVGFQLSFATAWGLILLVPYVSKLLRPIQDRLYYKIFILPFVVCGVAQLVSLPLSAYYFQRMPMISFVSNLIVVPLVSVVVIGSLILLFAALLLPILGMLAGSFLNPLIHLTLYFINLFGSEQVSVLLHFQVTGIMVILYYVFLLFVSMSVYSRKARRLAILYILLVAIGAVSFGLLSNKYDSRITVFSVSRGMVAVDRSAHPQVVLSNLPLKDYLVSEKIIEPYLANCNIDNPNLIALSNEYMTLENIEYLYNQSDSSKVYLPQSAQYAIKDIFCADNLPFDSLRINFFASTIPIIKPDRSGIYLSGGMLVYDFDSSMILFMDDRLEPPVYLDLLQDQDKGLIIVKPSIGKSEYTSLIADRKSALMQLICGRASEEVGKMMMENKTGSVGLPEVIQTSQVGAVEIVIKNGRARARKY
jgi:competence protein ComEC